MSEILKSKPWEIPSSVLSKIADFLRPNAEYLNSAKPEVRALADPYGKIAGYSVSVRGNVPDAYFDAKGEFLYSVTGVLEFDGGPEKSALAHDAMKLAGFSEAVTASGKRVWQKAFPSASRTDSPSERIDPFSSEGLALIRDLSFQQDRLDIVRRIYAKKNGLKVSIPPFTDEDVRAFAKAGSVTAKDFSELKKLWLVSAATYSSLKVEVAKALPSQLLDSRFSSSFEKKLPNGSTVEISPGWHGIGRGELEALRKEGVLTSEIFKASSESLDLVDKRTNDLLRVMKGSRAALENLKSETASA